MCILGHLNGTVRIASGHVGSVMAWGDVAAANDIAVHGPEQSLAACSFMKGQNESMRATDMLQMRQAG